MMPTKSSTRNQQRRARYAKLAAENRQQKSDRPQHAAQNGVEETLRFVQSVAKRQTPKKRQTPPPSAPKTEASVRSFVKQLPMTQPMRAPEVTKPVEKPARVPTPAILAKQPSTEACASCALCTRRGDDICSPDAVISCLKKQKEEQEALEFQEAFLVFINS